MDKYHHPLEDDIKNSLHNTIAFYRGFKNWPKYPVKDYIKAAIMWSYRKRPNGTD